MEYELHGSVKDVVGIAPIAITGNGTTVSAIIDTQGFESFEWAVMSGVITDGAYAFLLEDGDDAGLSDNATVAAALTIGTVPAYADTDDGVAKRVGVISKKRYQRLTITASGVTTGGLFSVEAILSHAHSRPVA